MSDLTTCFRRVDYDLDGLLHCIDTGDIGRNTPLFAKEVIIWLPA